MELLDLLEQRVGVLLDETAALRAENRRLRDEVELAALLAEEREAINAAEQQALRAERDAITGERDGIREELGQTKEELAQTRDDLAHERQVREQALSRVDALLSRIQAGLDAGLENGESPVDADGSQVNGNADDTSGDTPQDEQPTSSPGGFSVPEDRA